MTTTTNEGEIIVELEPTSTYTRWPCIVCGGSTDKELVNAVFYEAGELLFVCGRCLDDPDGTSSRLEEHASRLEGNAAWLREQAAKRWVLPSRDEWEKANDEAEFDHLPPRP